MHITRAPRAPWFDVLAGLIACCWLSGGCTVGEAIEPGGKGLACRAGGACDPGLVCMTGTCVEPQEPFIDPSTRGRPDGGLAFSDSRAECTEGVRACYGGPAGSENVGLCRAGQQACVDGKWSPCTGEVRPDAERADGQDNDCDGEYDEDFPCAAGQTQPCGLATGACEPGEQLCRDGGWEACQGGTTAAAEVCDGVDNDCDGEVDEGLVQACYSGPAETEGSGLCRGGTQRCVGGHFGACEQEVTPVDETCDGEDNDCDGQVDESCDCRAGEQRPCGSDVGSCRPGTQHCSAQGRWLPCEGAVTPAAEVCDGADNDCDGVIDDNLQRDCYSGAPGTRDQGICRGGTQTCTAGSWGPCLGETVPRTELCDGQDNNCNGQADEGCSCITDDSQLCGSTIGECAKGLQTCDAQGEWGACEGEVTPTAEVCDGADNNCNGSIDESLSRGCYSGAAGTEGVGPCRGGTQTCTSGSWGACVGQLTPAAEICDGLDNNCNGPVDEALSRNCYSGAAGTEGVGPCRAGTQTCTGGSWGACVGQVRPAAEVCDGLDNDCNGLVDEGLSRGCYTGAAGTEGVGLCRGGNQTCTSGSWGDCVGQVTPAAEVCDDRDNDCDGSVDEALSRDCYTGRAGSEGVGPCHAGTETCSNGSWGSCVGQVTPVAEVCDGLDNNCEGTIDDYLLCVPGHHCAGSAGCVCGSSGTLCGANLLCCSGNCLTSCDLCGPNCVVFENAQQVNQIQRDGGLRISAKFWHGWRFEVTAPVRAKAIGFYGEVAYQATTRIFGALVALSGPHDVPDKLDLTGSDVLGTTTFDLPAERQGMQVVKGPIDVSLFPGWYAVIFGAGAFGAPSTSAGTAVNGHTAVPNASYPITINRQQGYLTQQGDLTVRFFVETQP